MKVTISFRHLEHTEALDERIHEKSEKLAKYLEGNTTMKWSCYVKEGNHYAEVMLNGPTFNYHATAHTDSLYKTIDVVVDKLEKQLFKKKEKWKGRRGKASSELVIADPETAWTDYDEDFFKEAS